MDGAVARVAQPAVVEDQRLRYGPFQEQLAILGPGKGIAQDGQRPVAVQVGGKGIEAGTAHGGNVVLVSAALRPGRAAPWRCFCTGGLMYHLPVGSRYGHRTGIVKGKGWPLGRLAVARPRQDNGME